VDSDILFGTILNGLTSGGVYALVALGFGVVYRTTQVFNFAQGDFAALGAYLCFSIVVRMEQPYWLGLLIGCLGVGFVGILVERIVLRRLYKHGGVYTFIATIGLSLAIQAAIRLVWGPITQTIPSAFGSLPVTFLGLRVVPERVWILSLSMMLAAILFAFFKFTRFGTAMRASAQNRRVASLLGINVNRTFMAAFFLSGAVAAFAGILIAPTTFLVPPMGALLGTPGMVAALVGGLGSMQGAIVGGLLIGLVQALSVLLIDPRYGPIATFAVLIVVLLWKPSGIFGEEATTGRLV
jgi:branched-chain amino acid transport system permease protein